MGIGFVFFADHGGHSAPASRTCLAPIPAGILLARPLTKMFHFGTAKNSEQKKICRKADN
jgi:hypothetical protein